MRRSLRILALVLLVPAAGLWTSCRTTRPAVDEGMSVLATTRVESDPALERTISLLDPRFEENEGERTAVFSLRLERESALHVAIHVDWYDALGHSAELLPEAWFHVHLVRGQPRVLQVRAPSTRVRSFRLRIQRPEAVH